MSDHVGNGASGSSWRSNDSHTLVKQPKSSEINDFDAEQNNQSSECNICGNVRFDIEDLKKREVTSCQEMARTYKRKIEQLTKLVFVLVFFFILLVLYVIVVYNDMSFQINMTKQEVKNGECVLGKRCQYYGNDIIESTSLYRNNEELLDKMSELEKQEIVDSCSNLNAIDKEKPSEKSGYTSWDALKNSLFRNGGYLAAISFVMILIIRNTSNVGHLKSDTKSALEDTRKNIADLQDALTSSQTQTNENIILINTALEENKRNVRGLTTFRENQKRSGFFVKLNIEDELRVRTEHKINIFKQHFDKKSDSFNEEDCTYTAPVTGWYTLGGHLVQCGEGVLELGVSIGIGWFSLLAGTDSHDDFRKGMTVRRLIEGDRVYLYVERISGDATVAECGFFGHLLG